LSNPRSLILSIRKPFADRIFDGCKTFELRRLRPRLLSGDRVFVYVPSPVQAFEGWFTVASVVSGSPTAVWRQVAGQAGVSRADYRNYFAGAKAAFAIEVERAQRFNETIALEHLQEAAPGFRPPQGYHYLKSERKVDAFIRSALPAA